MGQVFDKFTEIIIRGKVSGKTTSNDSENLSLLDLGSPDVTSTDLNSAATLNNDMSKETQSDMDLLCDIFTNNVVADEILKPVSTNKIEVLSGN